MTRIDITQGSSWSKPFIIEYSDGTDLDLTGWSIRGEIRPWGQPDVVLSFFFVSAVPQPQVALTDEQTAGLLEGVYDFDVTAHNPNGDEYKLTLFLVINGTDGESPAGPGNTITWLPNEGVGTAEYLLESSLTAYGPWVALLRIPSVRGGQYYDAEKKVFVYQDLTGSEDTLYRLSAIGEDGLTFATTPPFTGNGDVAPAASIAAVRLDADYGGKGKLQYRAPNGMPIEGAVIRVFREMQFSQTGATPLGTTRTDSRGNWIDPLFVSAGESYVVQFHKEGLYGPDHVEVVV